ncbi:MAG: NAD(P)H-hydrate epimerase [Planctomycetota bacterium]
MSSNEDISLTRAQVREVDRRAIEEYRIPGIILMENAAGNATRYVMKAAPEGGSVAVVCGRGNNGGDGFVIARHLFNAGITVEIFLVCDPARLTGDAAINARIAEEMHIHRYAFDTDAHIREAAPRLQRADVIVDAILGTGFSGQVRSPLDLAIEAINRCSRAKVIAVDLPSGLDCDTGQPSNATVRATMTVTFVARKVGFDAVGASVYTGEIHVADIGAPRTVVQEVLSSAAGSE